MLDKFLALLNDVKFLLIFFLTILLGILYKVNTESMKKADISSLLKIQQKLEKELNYWKEKNLILEQKINLLRENKNKIKLYDNILKKDFIRYPENNTPKVLIFK